MHELGGEDIHRIRVVQNISDGGRSIQVRVGQTVFNVVYTNIRFSGLGDLGSGPNALGYSRSDLSAS
jgi:hypothetical protein